MEGSTSNNNIIDEDEIQPVNSEEILAEDDEHSQLLLNISIDKIENGSGDSLNTDAESYSSNSSVYQMSIMEKFNFIATRILYSKYFQYYYFMVVILSVASLVLTYVLDSTNKLYFLLEGFIILALIIEVTIRLLAQRKYYFYSFWNILDLIILGICLWLFNFTEMNSPLNENDSIIDNSILIIRYVIQFVRLGILLKKNKTSGANQKRKSVNFSHLKRKSTYGSFNPTSHHGRGRRNKLKDGEEKMDKDEEDNEEDEGEEGYQSNSNIDSRIFNPYGIRYDSIDDSHISQYYGNSIQNESFMSPNTLSQSLARDYASFLQGSQGSIGINIDSNANLAKMFYREDTNPEFDSKKSLNNPSINSLNEDVYQKLMHSNIEDNNKPPYGGLPRPKNSGDRIPSSSTQRTSGVDQSNDSLSTNPIETPSSSIISPSSSYIKKHQLPPPQKSFSSEVSFSLSLPPKVGKKHNRIAHTNQSSTFNEIPNKINLLTPILYGSPSTFVSSNN